MPDFITIKEYKLTSPYTKEAIKLVNSQFATVFDVMSFSLFLSFVKEPLQDFLLTSVEIFIVSV